MISQRGGDKDHDATDNNGVSMPQMLASIIIRLTWNYLPRRFGVGGTRDIRERVCKVLMYMTG